MQRLTLFVCLCSLLMVGGCARRISQNYYAAGSVGEASHTYRGYIVSVRKVEIGGGESFSDNKAGMAVGAIGGGLLGSQIGGGVKANIVGGVLGAALGAAAGGFAEDALSSQDGMEYSVQLDNGQLMTVVQGVDEVYPVGQRVLVIVSNEGRSRIVPDNTPAPVRVVQAQPPQYTPAAVAPQAAPAPYQGPVQYVQAAPQPQPVQYVQAVPAHQQQIAQPTVQYVRR